MSSDERDGRDAVFVTGGTGFVGSALVRRLADSGYTVHVFARASSRRDHLEDARLIWHTGDVCDSASVRSSLRAAGAAATDAGERLFVVHAAAVISYRSSDSELSRRVNLEGTEHVLAACREVDLERLCYVSSVVAVGHAPDATSALDEEARFNGSELDCAYVSTKRAAEELVLGADDLNVVVVNPGAIFGPAPEPSNTTRFLARFAEPRSFVLLPPGSLSVVGVEDVARGILLALAHGTRGRRYLLTESSWRFVDLVEFVTAQLGGRTRRATLPTPLWRLVVSLATVVDRVRPFEFTGPEALRLLGVHYRFDSSRARNELGWAPRPFEEVLSETLRWMRRERLLPG